MAGTIMPFMVKNYVSYHPRCWIAPQLRIFTGTTRRDS